MKRILQSILTLILMLSVATVSAQVNSKLDAMFRDLRSQGQDCDIKYSNNSRDIGLKVAYHAFFRLYNEADSATLTTAEIQRRNSLKDTYNRLWSTMEELSHNALKCNKWEYHQDGNDTIEWTLLLKDTGKDLDDVFFYNTSRYIMNVSQALEYASFQYINFPQTYPGPAVKGAGMMGYTCVIDSTIHATEPFDRATFMASLQPVFASDSIKSFEVYYKHDPSVKSNNDKIRWIGEKGIMSGETRGIVYEINDETLAHLTLKKLQEAILNYVCQYRNEFIMWDYSTFPLGISSNSMFSSEIRLPSAGKPYTTINCCQHYDRQTETNKYFFIVSETTGGRFLPCNFYEVKSATDE